MGKRFVVITLSVAQAERFVALANMLPVGDALDKIMPQRREKMHDAWHEVLASLRTEIARITRTVGLENSR